MDSSYEVLSSDFNDLNSLNSNFYVFWLESALNLQKKEYLGFHRDAEPPLVAEFILDDSNHKNSLSPVNSKNISKVSRFITETIYK